MPEKSKKRKIRNKSAAVFYSRKNIFKIKSQIRKVKRMFKNRNFFFVSNKKSRCNLNFFTEKPRSERQICKLPVMRLNSIIKTTCRNEFFAVIKTYIIKRKNSRTHIGNRRNGFHRKMSFVNIRKYVHKNAFTSF